MATGAMNLGTAVARQGDLERGRVLLEEALALNRERGHVVSIVYCLTHLGAITLALGHRARASALLREGLMTASVNTLKTALTEVLVHLAHVAVIDGQLEHAVRLLGAAEALREAVGAAFDPLLPAEHERAVAAIHHALSEAAFTEAWMAGRALSTQEAVTEGLTQVERV
jgi:hypothetical protein